MAILKFAHAVNRLPVPAGQFGFKGVAARILGQRDIEAGFSTAAWLDAAVLFHLRDKVIAVFQG